MTLAASRIAEIRERVASGSCDGSDYEEIVYELLGDRAALKADNAALRDALQPFAAIADQYDDREDSGFEVLADMDVLAPALILGHFRDARAALAQQEGQT